MSFEFFWIVLLLLPLMLFCQSKQAHCDAPIEGFLNGIPFMANLTYWGLDVKVLSYFFWPLFPGKNIVLDSPRLRLIGDWTKRGKGNILFCMSLFDEAAVLMLGSSFIIQFFQFYNDTQPLSWSTRQNLGGGKMTREPYLLAPEARLAFGVVEWGQLLFRMCSNLVKFPNLPKLTGEENKLLKSLMSGLTCEQVAGKLEISVETVLETIETILDKLDLENLAEVVIKVLHDAKKLKSVKDIFNRTPEELLELCKKANVLTIRDMFLASGLGDGNKTR